jgi:DNA-binding response OmpR family regulator
LAVEFLRTHLRSDPEGLPQAIFLDLKMPVLNGFEVLDWLRTQSFPSSMPIIVLSGSQQQDDRDRALAMGAADYLVKPINVRDLHRILQHVCPPAPKEWSDA